MILKLVLIIFMLSWILMPTIYAEPNENDTYLTKSTDPEGNQSSQKEIDYVGFASMFANVIMAALIGWQLKVYRNEIQKRQRPWIGRQSRDDNIEVRPNGDGTATLVFKLINHGELPALDVRVQSLIAKNEPLSGEIPQFELDKDKPNAVGPKDYYFHSADLTKEDFDKYNNSKLWYAFKTTYTDPTKKIKGIYEIRGHFENKKDTFDYSHIQ